MSAAIHGMVTHMEKRVKPGTALRVQVLHGDNAEAVQPLHDAIDARFACTWMPMGAVTPVLGAHTGPGVIGVFYAPLSAFEAVP